MASSRKSFPCRCHSPALPCGSLHRGGSCPLRPCKPQAESPAAGADFEFTYAVTSQGGTTHPALYSILDQAGATEGRMTGLYSPGQLQLYLYSRDAATTETSGDNFFTDVYIDADQTLFNAGKLYRTLRDSVVSSYPLVGTFFPEWSLPNYVSQAQLAQMLGVPDSQVAMAGHVRLHPETGPQVDRPTRTTIPRLYLFSVPVGGRWLPHAGAGPAPQVSSF